MFLLMDGKSDLTHGKDCVGTVLVAGSEGEAVPQELLELADDSVLIKGRTKEVDSLNVSVATAIVLNSLLN